MAMIHTLHVQLADIEPPIWRRVVVPGDITLRQLHHVLQIVMGWTHSHLYEFEVTGKNGKVVRYGEMDEEEDDTLLDDRQISLAQVASKKDARFLYTYDLGDNWTHYVKVESKLAVVPENPCPWCLGGQRAAPPEDVGGEQGYKEFLLAWEDQLHPEHHRMREWVGAQYQPELFSVQQANAGLAFFIAISQPDDDDELGE
jgi:hypothetical protein